MKASKTLYFSGKMVLRKFGMRKGLAGGKLVMKGWIGLLCGCVVACKSMNADERIQMFDLLFLSNLDILDRVEGL